MLKNETDLKLKRNFTPEEVELLNKRYRPLSARDRIRQLYKDFACSEVMLTSSFAATSALLLKLLSDVNKDQVVYFIDTGYHFDETLCYKDQLTKDAVWSDPIVTEIVPFEKFYPAEDYHQNYLASHGNEPYCAFVVRPKVSKFEKRFADKLA